MAENNDQQKSDPRVAGIATVGWVSLAALGISIPLTAIAGAFAGWLAAAIPLTIIFGAGLMAVRIWSSGEKQVNVTENQALHTRLNDLEERLSNLEMVDSIEAHFAERHRHAPAPNQPAGERPIMGPPAREDAAP